MVLERAFQVKTMLADVALESSHVRVRQLVRLQHRRSLELGRAEIARVRRVRGVDDHVSPKAAGSREAFAAGRALVKPRVSVHQLVIAQRSVAQQFFLANGTLERSSSRVRLGLVFLQRAFSLRQNRRKLSIKYYPVK